MKTIGFIGVGAMGQRMVHRLAVSGYKVAIYDVDTGAFDGRDDVHVAASVAELAAGSAVVFMSLPSPSVVKQVTAGEGGLLENLVPGQVIIDVGTTDPETTINLAAEVEAAGGMYLDCPVSGGVMRAETGALTIMVGGDQAALARVRPELECIGDYIVHCGPAGSGQVAKLCNNMLTAANLAALCETFLTGVKYGLDATVLRDVISRSSGGSWLLDAWVTSTVFENDYSPRFRLDLMHKDITLFATAAANVDAAAPVCSAAREMFRGARVQGLGSRDMTSLMQFYERLIGCRLLPGTSEVLDHPAEVGQ